MTTFEIEQQLFARLGALVTGPRSELSPWANPAAAPDTALEQWLGQQQDSADIGRVLSGVAAATHASSAELVTGATGIDYTAYASATGEAVGITTMLDGRLRFETPAPTARSLGIVADLMGRTYVRFVDFAVSAPVIDALVFAALIDHARRDHLHRAADGLEAPSVAVPVDAIRAVLDGAGAPPGLCTVVAQAAGVEASSASPTIAESLGRLAASGTVDLSAGAASLAGVAAAIPLRFALLTARLAFTNIEVNGAGAVESGGFRCVQGGVIDLMTIEALQGSVQFRIVSSDALLTFMETAFAGAGEPVG